MLQRFEPESQRLVVADLMPNAGRGTDPPKGKAHHACTPFKGRVIRPKLATAISRKYFSKHTTTTWPELLCPNMIIPSSYATTYKTRFGMFILGMVCGLTAGMHIDRFVYARGDHRNAPHENAI
jgi:hypothetical protein